MWLVLCMGFVAEERSNLIQIAIAAVCLLLAGLLVFHNIRLTRRRVLYNHAIVYPRHP